MGLFDYFIVTFEIGLKHFFEKLNRYTVTISLLLIGWNVYCLCTDNADRFMTSLLLTIIFALSTFFVLGIYVQVKMYPHRKRNEQIEKMFLDIGLISPSGDIPQFQGEEEDEYVKIMAFKTVIPLHIWENKKPHLETYLNTKIIAIRYYKNNNNLVNLVLEKQLLPSSVDWSDYYLQYDKLILGISHLEEIGIDLNNQPHFFVTGETGCGKSNLMKSLIYQCLAKKHEVKLIDFKRGVSYSVFNKNLEIYSDYESILNLLEELVDLTNKRLDTLTENEVENILEYNLLPNRHMSRLVVFIDELAELLKSSDKEVNKAVTGHLETLTRISRAVGINLVMGLQRVDSTIITGQIKNNVSTRIVGRFIDPEPSRIMLGNDLATNLPNIKGRFILRADNFIEFQAFFVQKENMSLASLPLKKERSKEVREQPKPIKSEDHKSKKLDFTFDDII